MFSPRQHAQLTPVYLSANVKTGKINPFLTNGLSQCYHLEESTFILRDIRSEFDFLFHFSMNFL